jgi:uncharacterized protein (DUF362 family)
MAEAGIGKVTANSFVEGGKALVSSVKAASNVKESVLRSVDLIGGFSKVVEKGDEVLLKPTSTQETLRPVQATQTSSKLS